MQVLLHWSLSPFAPCCRSAQAWGLLTGPPVSWIHFAWMEAENLRKRHRQEFQVSTKQLALKQLVCAGHCAVVDLAGLAEDVEAWTAGGPVEAVLAGRA